MLLGVRCYFSGQFALHLQSFKERYDTRRFTQIYLVINQYLYATTACIYIQDGALILEQVDASFHSILIMSSTSPRQSWLHLLVPRGTHHFGSENFRFRQSFQIAG